MNRPENKEVRKGMPGQTTGGASTNGETHSEDNDLRAAHARSLRNRADLSGGGPCGCFYCLAVFDASEVWDWIDGTTAL